MKTAYRTLRKIIALILGVPVLIVGLILIPLPGPGILISLLGLIILAQEFDWAEKHVERGKAELKKVVDKNKRRLDRKK